MESKKETDTKKEKDDNNWLPLETNPEVLNKYIHGLGFDTSKLSFMDLFSVEEWACQMCPEPNLAVLFLFPTKKCQKDYKKIEDERIKKDG